MTVLNQFVSLGSRQNAAGINEHSSVLQCNKEKDFLFNCCIDPSCSSLEYSFFPIL